VNIDALLSPVVRQVIAPVWARHERSGYLSAYRGLLKTQWDEARVVSNRQRDAVARLVEHATGQSSFWSDRFEACGLGEGIKELDDLRLLPVLTKDDVRDYASRHRQQILSDPSVVRNTTSGSTGVAMEVFADEATMQFRRACTLRSDEWTGWRFGERRALVWGNPEYLSRGWRGRLRNTLLNREIYLDTLKMDPAAMQAFVSTIENKRPTLLLGHAHSLYLLACYVSQNGGSSYRPRGIISTAMVLTDRERRRIESVFDSRVTNRYGCEEVGLIACECDHHSGLHVNADGVYVEVLRADGTPASPGESGAVVVTDLLNTAMPLIRYQIGDMASLSDQSCPCGRGLPLLERIEGRVADYVTTATGEFISGISLTENFAMLVSGIKQLQIVQEAVGDFVFRIVRDDDFNDHSLQQIAELVAERFGNRATYAIEYVDSIPQEPSGKYRFCISRVANAYS
jgi:phenylacetate-CoA ligase